MVYRVSDGKRVLLTGAQMPRDFPEKQLVEPKQVTFKAKTGSRFMGSYLYLRTRPRVGPR